MTKLKPVQIAAGILILAALIGLISLANKSKTLQRKLEEANARLETINPNYQKLSQQEAVLSNKNADLVKENAALKTDRENLMLQIKSLLQERSKAADLAANLEKANNNLAALTKEKSELEERVKTQKEESSRLQAAQKDMIAKWDSLKTSCDRAEQTVRIKDLNRRVGELQKDKTAVSGQLKRAQNDLDQLKAQKTKTDLENTSLKSQLKDTKQALTEAMNKNKKMWEQVQNTPKKVAELARQNKLLIAETAQMHYNLGTFYTRNKQYDRAAVEFEKVIEIDPNNANAQFNLGYIYAEYLVNRQKAAKHFRLYLGLAKPEDKDVDWVKKYLLTWEAYDAKTQIQ